MQENIPDCLVLKLEEVERANNKVDTTVYIFYDKKTHHFIVRGRRRYTPVHKSCCYSYECEFANDLVHFLQYIICKDYQINEILYNYDNFPRNSNEITFDFLNEYDHSDYEISGYNDIKFTKGRILKNLRMLRNVFNYYK